MSLLPPFFMSIYNHYHKSEDNQHKYEHFKDEKLLQYESLVNPLWNRKMKKKKKKGRGYTVAHYDL